jgi:tripartite-type tricarboxylate transporter receptor subunit TctC
VTLIATTPNMLVVHPSLPVKSVKDLIALAKRMPGKLDYASWGSGSLAHMAGELFDKMAGVQMSHIPYSGGGPAIIAVIGGQTPIGFPTAPAALPHMKAGKLHGLAVTNVERSAWMPELPTMSEAGLPGYEANNWMGVLVPSATPKDIVARLSSEMNKLVKVPDMKDRLRNAGMDAVGTTPEQFSSYIRSEVDKWAKIVKAVGARVD